MRKKLNGKIPRPSLEKPPTAEIFEGRGRNIGKWYFRLKANNGEIIAGSEAYANKWNAKRGARKHTSLLVEL